MVIILRWQHAPAGGQEGGEAGAHAAKNARQTLSGGAGGLQSKRAHKPKRPEKPRFFGCVREFVGAFGLPPVSVFAFCVSVCFALWLSSCTLLAPCFLALLQPDWCKPAVQDIHHYALWAREGTPERPRG